VGIKDVPDPQAESRQQKDESEPSDNEQHKTADQESYRTAHVITDVDLPSAYEQKREQGSNAGAFCA
jgi:hypothetical protein